MTHGSLFSGIGGFDLAARNVGWDNVFHCEINPFRRAILDYHFPKSKSHEDIFKTDFSIYRGKVDVLSGGFPCQPFSFAGHRKGTNDDRFIWQEMLRAIRELSPSWILAENVYGFVNWESGLALEKVSADLELEGYKVQSVILPAAGIGAPHRRRRVWIIAHSVKNDGRPISQKAERKGREEWLSKWNEFYKLVESAEIWQAESISSFSSTWERFPLEPAFYRRNDGLSERMDKRAVRKWELESIKALGDAIVPQLAEVIFQTINDYEAQHEQDAR